MAKKTAPKQKVRTSRPYPASSFKDALPRERRLDV